MDSKTNFSQLLGRVLICALFLIGGYAKLTNPSGTITMMGHEGVPFPTLSMIVAIVIELGGGLLILVGLLTRPAAVVLGIWCIVTALVAHSNWADPNMKIHFLKNVGLAGGFAYIAAFGAGAFSLDAMLFRRRLADAH